MCIECWSCVGYHWAGGFSRVCVGLSLFSSGLRLTATQEKTPGLIRLLYWPGEVVPPGHCLVGKGPPVHPLYGI